MDILLSDKNLSDDLTNQPRPAPNGQNEKPPLDWFKIFHGDISLETPITPQDILDSWKRFNELTLREWEKFISGSNSIDTNIVPPEILEEWTHCRKLNVDPLSEPKNIILSPHDLQKRLADNKLFIQTSQPFLDRLYQTMKTTSVSMALFDREGYLLQVLEDQRYAEISALNKWVRGSLWTLECAGNNTVGSMLKNAKPLHIFGPQHYMKCFHYSTAASAPIFDPEGELIGGVTLIAALYGSHPHTLGMAIAAAHAIENELKIRKALDQRNAACNETDTMARLQKAIVSFIPDAMVAVNNEGRIYAINEPAQKMFGLADACGIGQLLHSIYEGEENRTLCDIINNRESVSDLEIRLQTAQGPGDFTLTCKHVLAESGVTIGKILIFSEIKRIKSLVTKIIGAKANFHFRDICRQNKDFSKIIDHAAMISESASSVLLLGESGTGKDILAQAIHNGSPRRNGPYVAINCAAIPRDLIASELFGHEEGAFTGSRRGGSQGKFELADGGTIFLDEIAETPLEIQAVLLRVIEDKRIVRVGGGHVREVDVRILSATNKDLIDEVHRGNFRKDLYYRLNVFSIHLPPLRERTDDIPLLVNLFIKKYETALGKTISAVDEKVWDVLMQYAWPGNVRELQNVVERMVNFAVSERLTADLIPPEVVGIHHRRHHKIVLESPEDTEKRLIRHLVTLKVNKSSIARQLDISRATLYRKMKKYGLEE